MTGHDMADKGFNFLFYLEKGRYINIRTLTCALLLRKYPNKLVECACFPPPCPK